MDFAGLLMLRRAMLFWLSAVLLAGCVRANLRPALQPTAPLPSPSSVLVYDRVVTAEEIKLRGCLARNDLGSSAHGLRKTCTSEKAPRGRFRFGWEHRTYYTRLDEC